MMDPGTDAVWVTFFPDFAAATKREESLTLHDLAERIVNTSASAKAGLPWLKLGLFGDTRTDKGSLRSNGNMKVCTGLEADYDGERVAFGDAVGILTEAGILSLVYTSPSHTDAKPRWRVLCQFSEERSPQQRDLYMARLNGVFHGIFAPESWTVSQSYYYGCVDHNPDHHAQLVAGTTIDLRSDLDATAIGRPEKPMANGHANERPVTSGAAYVPASDARLEGFRQSVLDSLRRSAVDGQKHTALRNAALALGGIQVAAGFTDAQAVQWLMDALPATVADWNAAKATAAWGLQEGRQKPLELEDRPRPNGAARPHSEPPPDDAPPLADDESDHGSAGGSQAKAKPAPDPRDLDGFDLTEDGIALAFTAKHKHALRYCHHTGAWFQWNGSIWRREETKLAFSWARQVCRAIARDAGKTKATLSRAATAAAVERFAQSDRAFAVTSEIWDTDPWLLGTPGGAVDLRTGMRRPAMAADYITKTTAVTPGELGDCPVWLAFLRQATGGDTEFARFLQQWCGYSLTGITREHALLFVYGPGGNGKSVFLNTVSGILGDYCRTAAMDTFTTTPGDRHPTDLAMLRGARLVTATETEEGRAWAEARIKQLTGGDPISARFMRQDFFSFLPQFKLTIAGNHKPTLKNVDEAARRRFNIAPFLHTPPQPDRGLETRLRDEWPGILAWMIAGCVDWQGNGLVRPKVVTDATADYFDAQDIIGRWLAERCILDPHLQEKPGRLVSDCRTWAADNGETPPTPAQFRSALERTRGIRYVTVRGTQHVRGIGFQAAPDRRQAWEDDA
jgi:P4 family phage/plasmid primase-like protien